MKGQNDLRNQIRSIDRKGYGAYKSIQGSYDFGNYILHIDNIQSDPFAPPSRMRVTVKQGTAGIPGELFSSKSRRTAVEDYITREFGRKCRDHVGKQPGGSGTSSAVNIDRCGQEILDRTSAVVNKNIVEARFVIGLPAKGRTIMGKEALYIFFDQLPKIIENSIIYKNMNKKQVKRHVETAEDQQFLRNELHKKGLVSFIGNEAILPRESGISDKPLKDERLISFQTPEELKCSFELPNKGLVTGMGIPEGVTLIVGGGYHGKSTLLRAIERGIYNHIPGDGREMVTTAPSAAKIRAEDGRSVIKVDISAFIDDLPNKDDTSAFTSENASGSTSQAANIVEAMESGTQLLLLDEDTSATNFMIRDSRMQNLVAKENEPITPFIDRVRELYDNMKVSTILVVGGSGDYFEVADHIIRMQNYIPGDVTAEAKEIAEHYKNDRIREKKDSFSGVKERAPQGDCFQLAPKGKVKAKGLNSIIYGRSNIDLGQVEQLVDSSQTNAISEIIKYAVKNYVDNESSLSSIIDKIYDDIEQKELDIISSFYGQHPGDLALPRKQEIMAAINRFRNLKVKQL
ncbi:MAG: ABC-ATPase domain-containing protein [Clostridiales bacterium]|nr:ABC-ATPase domain-containing protein [Clostridiales bacterium]MCF8022707.1 ABC-ATPase domain-containing protein [Clostridiales bacterium]